MSYLPLRHVRHLSATATATDPAAISISRAKFVSKLRSEHDPDKVLEIYSTVSNRNTSPLFSRYAQDLTVKSLAKASRFSDIENLIESNKNDPKVKQEPYLTTLIRSYGLAGMFDHALKTFNQMDELGTPRSTISFNGLLSACNHSKMFDKVPQLFDEIPQKYGISPDKVSYGILVKAYCKLDSPELGIDRLKEMEEKGVEITAITFSTILHSLYKKGSVEEAERIWNEMLSKGCLADVGAYNVRIMHAHDGEPESVKKLIEEMVDMGLKADTISYNYLMTCYCKNEMMAEAKKVYEGLEDNGCRPNGATFGTLIYYLCRNEMFEYGYRVFKESVKVNKIPDFCILKPLVEGLAKRSNRKDAKGLIRTAKKKFPPSFLNSWEKIEEEFGLVSANSGDVQEART